VEEWREGLLLRGRWLGVAAEAVWALACLWMCWLENVQTCRRMVMHLLSLRDVPKIFLVDARDRDSVRSSLNAGILFDLEAGHVVLIIQQKDRTRLL